MLDIAETIYLGTNLKMKPNYIVFDVILIEKCRKHIGRSFIDRKLKKKGLIFELKVNLSQRFNICRSFRFSVPLSLSLALSFSTFDTSKISISSNRIVSTSPLMQYLSPDFCRIIEYFLYYQKSTK